MRIGIWGLFGGPVTVRVDFSWVVMDRFLLGVKFLAFPELPLRLTGELQSCGGRGQVHVFGQRMFAKVPC